MSLELRFESNANGVTQLIGNRFELSQSHGHYVLPDLVLYSPPHIGAVVTRLHVEAVEGVHNDLESWLRDHWLTASPAGSHVMGKVALTRNATVPAFVDNASRRYGDPRNDSLGRVSVTWKLEGVSSQHGSVHDVRSVVLNFVPEGGHGEQARPDTVVVVGHRSDPWLNDVAAIDFAAIDFGTSSSTVTFYGLNPNRSMLDPAQAQYLAKSLATILQDSPADARAQVDWKNATQRIEQALAQRFPDYASATLSEVLHLLESKPVRLDFVNAVCDELERALWAARGDLSRWLVDRLHSAYDAAYRVPALATLRLHRVLFDELNEQFDTPSLLTVTNTVPLETVISVDTGHATGQMFRDLKRSFAGYDGTPIEGLRNSDGSEVHVGHLVAWFYEHLTRKTEDFVHDADRPRKASLPRLVVTYPTTTTPQNRERLQRLVKSSLGVKRVDTTYDEGVAAGLYFLMRDFGGVGAQAIGVETLRANSLRIEGTRSWRQVMLVLDIGAGTTDIALIGLNLEDITPDKLGNDPEVSGRYYRIEPEVLGSTGHQTLGGNYLTLRVFYWLKAAILDAMAARGPAIPEREQLCESLPDDFRPTGQRADLCAQAVISSDGMEPAPDSIIGELRSKLDTTYEVEADSLAFDYLWRKAERAKEEKLWKGEAYVMKKSDVIEFLGYLAAGNSKISPFVDNYKKLVPDDGVTLDPESFEKLARPLLAQAVDLAHHLAKNRLTKLPGGRLDRVMLSGKTSQMPLVARVVEERMVRRAGEYVPESERNRGPVKQPSVDVETEFAKQAASLGACWAASIVEYVPPQADIEEITNGRTVQTISVDNLFTALPSNFTVNTNDLPIKVFDIGTPFTELDAEGTIGVRAKRWIPLPQTYELQREMGPGQILRWGHFTFKHHAEDEGFTFDPPTWEWTHGIAPTMAAQVELDQTCSPKLYLCNKGLPHYVSRGHSVTLWDAPPENADGRSPRLPKLIVRTSRGTPADREREETLCEEQDLAGNTAAAFPLFVHLEDDPDTRPVAAFDRPLPPVSPNHPSYQFFVVTPDGTETFVDEVAPPGPPSPRVPYRVTVTVRGELRVHRGELPYLTANSMEEVQERPGTVLTVKLDERQTPPKPSWLPFNGTH